MLSACRRVRIECRVICRFQTKHPVSGQNSSLSQPRIVRIGRLHRFMTTRRDTPQRGTISDNMFYLTAVKSHRRSMTRKNLKTPERLGRVRGANVRWSLCLSACPWDFWRCTPVSHGKNIIRTPGIILSVHPYFRLPTQNIHRLRSGIQATVDQHAVSRVIVVRINT